MRRRLTSLVWCLVCHALTGIHALHAAPPAAPPEAGETTARLSPPRGWNSYTGYSIAVTEKELLKNIDFLSEKLLPYGYDTVTVDNGWFLSGQGEGITIALDAYGRPEAHEHFFPHGLKYTIDYAHKKGVKFGIWLLRGINRRAVEENLPVEGTKYRMRDIVDLKSMCPWAVAPWWNYGVDMTRPGAQEYYDGLIRKYADLGVDFIKFDDIVPNPDEVEAVAKAIGKCGRPIVLSLSPGDEIKVQHSDAYKKANMVRITSDIWDNRNSLDTAFQRWEEMQTYTGAEVGSFLDMDMVCFGRLCVVNQDGGWECKLTPDQKRTFMVQRALAASPLMLGGVLYRTDDFSLSLFTNPDILRCDQNGVIGRLAHRDGKLDVWKTPERGNENNGWIGLFNRDGGKKMSVELSAKQLGLAPEQSYLLKNLWTGETLPAAGKRLFEIPADGVVFLSYRKPVDMQKRAEELKDLKWGMFICWSFSTFSGKEWTPGIQDAAFFAAKGCDTDQWARTAREAGMGYILFLTKHHDGFCLWDTKTTDRKVTKSPLGIDVLARLRKSCDKHGIKLALYFSEGDWTFPGSKDGQGGGTGRNPGVVKAQIEELCTRYGPIEFYWMDCAAGHAGLDHQEIMAWVKGFQPGCFVGFNGGGGDLRAGEMGRPGKVGAPYLVGEFTYPIQPEHEGGAMWFYSLPRHDDLCHPPEKIYRDYAGAVKYGNIFSLDVGPDYEGKLRRIDIETLRKAGEMIRNPPPPPPPSLSAGKPARSSSTWPEPGYEADKAFDDDDSTRWGAAADARSGWLEVDLGAPTLVGRAVVKELGYHRTQEFAIEYRDGETWKAAVTGTTIAGEKAFDFTPVTARFFRLNIRKAKEVPTIEEFQLFKPSLR